MFKSIVFFRFTRPVDSSAEFFEHLNDRLLEEAIKPCGPQEFSRAGWCAPCRHALAQLAYSADGHKGPWLIALQINERILPNDVLRQAVAERVAIIEQNEGRAVRRREKAEIKDQLSLEMLPQAFVRTRIIYAYIWPERGYLAVAGTANQADTLTSHLRQTLGSLPIVPMHTVESPEHLFTNWLTGVADIKAPFGLADRCQLQGDESAQISVRNMDLHDEDLQPHLEHGMTVKELELDWSNRLRMVVTQDLQFKSIRQLDELSLMLMDQEGDDPGERFDASFIIITGELEVMRRTLVGALGGLVELPADPTAIPAPVESFNQDQGEEDFNQPDHSHVDDGQASLLELATWWVVYNQICSISSIQRQLRIGYSKAFELVVEMESNGTVSAPDNKGFRQVLVTEHQKVAS